jgi:hypothetical protein
MLTFTARIASEVSGIPHNTINSLLARGALTVEGDAPGMGRARAYDIATIAKLSLMNDLMGGLGMRPEEAGNFALLCEAPFKRLVIGSQQTPGTAYLVQRFTNEKDGHESAIVYGIGEVERLLACDEEQPYALTINITKSFSRTITRLINAGVLPPDWQARERSAAGLDSKGSNS